MELLQDVTTIPKRELRPPNLDAHLLCLQGHPAYLTSMSPLYPSLGGIADGTLHCCECRTSEYVVVRMIIKQED